MTYYFPTKEELIKYFNGKTEKVFVHYFNIATFFLKKEELLELPVDQRQDFFVAKMKKLPDEAKQLYYTKLTELVKAKVLNQDGFGFKLSIDGCMPNSIYYLKDILASGNVELISLARQYCDKEELQQASSFLTVEQKEKLMSIVVFLNNKGESNHDLH